MTPRLAPLLLVALLAVLVSGCETTREKSARLAASNTFALAEEQGIDVKRANRDIEVTGAEVLTDDFGQAAVVTMTVDADEPQVAVPVELSIADKQGKELFRNDTPGLDAALTGPAALPAKGEAFWIYDQLTLAGEPGKTEATIGTGKPATGKLPEFKVTAGDITDDADGVMLDGRIKSDGGPLQRKIVIYGLAREGKKIVAAGTAQLEKLPPKRRTRFQMYFVGDPKGAEIDFFVPPTTFE